MDPVAVVLVVLALEGLIFAGVIGWYALARRPGKVERPASGYRPRPRDQGDTREPAPPASGTGVVPPRGAA